MKEFFSNLVYRLTSRKFLVVFFPALIIGLNNSYNWGLSEEDIGKITMAVIAFIAAEGGADVASRFKGE